MTIGLLLIATGKYDQFVYPLLESVDKFFFKDHKVQVFIFSDKEINEEPSRLEVFRIPVKHKSFPYASLLRYRYFDDNRMHFDCDYLFYSDVDMRFEAEVGEEILGNLVAVQHPGFWRGGWGSQNVNRSSLAYLPKDKWRNYCAGGFQGGRTEEYLKACNILNARIQDDELRGVMAEWHDESHWNWYLKMKAKNIKMLSPSYCFPEADWAKGLPFDRKLVALEKNHKLVRS